MMTCMLEFVCRQETILDLLAFQGLLEGYAQNL